MEFDKMSRGQRGMKHIITTGQLRQQNRQYWECSCGRSGSVGPFLDVQEAAEKHIPEGAPRAYRYRGTR